MAAVAVSLLLVAGCRGAPPGGGPALAGDLATAGRNVVVVLSDTHRADHAFSPGGGRPAPNVELLARDGVRFARAFAPIPISAPSYATLLTGEPPAVHGLVNNQQRLSAALPLLQERLRDAGYATAAVVSNPFCSAGHGFGRGFDHFWDEIEGRGKEGVHVTAAAVDWLEERPAGRPFFLFVAYMDAHTPFLAEEVPPSLLVEVGGEPAAILRPENAHVVQRVPLVLAPGTSRVHLTYLERSGGPGSGLPGSGVADLRPAVPAGAPSPLHLVDVGLADKRLELRYGDGWEAVEGTRYRRMRNRAVLEVENDGGRESRTELRFRCYRVYGDDEYRSYYSAGVRSFDRHFGRLLGYLEAAGLYDDAVVVFVSDHGEMLGEHGSWGHVSDLYEETLRIPLVVKAPGLEPGSVHRGRFTLRDLHRLLLVLATGRGAEAGERFPFAGGGDPVAATFPPEAEDLLVAVRDGPLKLISNGGERFELYDLATDPGEASNLYPARRDEPRVRALVRRLGDELERISRLESLDLEAVPAEKLEELRALGYL